MKKLIWLFLIMPFVALAADVENDDDLGKTYVLFTEIVGSSKDKKGYAVPNDMLEQIRDRMTEVKSLSAGSFRDRRATLITFDANNQPSKFEGIQFDSPCEDFLVKDLDLIPGFQF